MTAYVDMYNVVEVKSSVAQEVPDLRGKVSAHACCLVYGTVYQGHARPSCRLLLALHVSDAQAEVGHMRVRARYAVYQSQGVKPAGH